MIQPLILTLLILAALYSFFAPLARIAKQVRQAKGTLSIHPLWPRIRRFVSEVLFQIKVIQDRPIPGLLHSFVFWGFLTFMVFTLDHFARGYGATLLGWGLIREVVETVVAVFAIFTLVGIVGLGIRRFILRPATLGRFSGTSLTVVTFIVTLMVTYLLDYYDCIPENTTAWWVNWWIHSLVILAFMALIPHSKHLHLAISPVTTFLKDLQIARVKPLDFEKEEFGAEKLLDLPKHTILSAYTCVECGRCKDHCPANTTGKVLDPKQFILDIRQGLKTKPDAAALGEFVNPEALWQCTTCGACTTVCPVGVEHVVPILELRRGQVAAGTFPTPMGNLFKGLEGSGKNPWAYQPQDGEEFLKKNGAPGFAGQDVLYWVGCMGRYEPQYQKVSKAFMQLLTKTGVSWGVLKDEHCTGDAARRAGNEFLFQQLASENIAMLNEAKPKTIVSTCPHCVWTLQEYKDLGLEKSIRIVHHTEFLREQMEAGRLSAGKTDTTLVYHDACYLSRYAGPGGTKNPRALLARTGARLVEAPRHHTNSFCCGAGGAMLFSEETQGKRVNHERTDELLSTRAPTVATSCPFCRMMIRDGLSDRSRTDVAVLDIAEILQG